MILLIELSYERKYKLIKYPKVERIIMRGEIYKLYATVNNVHMLSI